MMHIGFLARQHRAVWLIASLLVLAALSTASTADAQQQPRQKEKSGRVTVQPGISAGVFRYRPGRWGLLGVELRNTMDEPAELLVASSFPGRPNVQYGRQLWVPPHAVRRSWYRVLPSAPPQGSTGVADVTSLVIRRREGAGDELLRNPHTDQMTYSSLVPLEQNRAITAYIVDLHDDEPVADIANGELPSEPAMDDDILEAVAVARVSGGYTRHLASLHQRELPPTSDALDALDHLVLLSDRLADDSAATTAVRRWVFDGGTLWIMLDQISPETAELLLGDLFACQAIDRVGLTDVLIENVSKDVITIADTTRSYEKPVPLVRCLVEDATVTHTVNGWPAAFWIKAGKGRVLVTTLESRGWTRERTASDPVASEAIYEVRLAATEPLKQLAKQLFAGEQNDAAPRGAPTEPFQPYLAEQIGYKIVTRPLVASALSAFCGVLLLAGLVLARQERLERLAWIGGAAAVLTALVLVVLGLSSRRAVPQTVAVAQLAELVPGSDDLQVSGRMAWYNPREMDQPIGGSDGGLIQIDLSGLEGDVRRLVWTDLDDWHWENLSLPAGVREGTFRYSTRLQEPPHVQLTFGPGGVEGTVDSGSFEQLADLVVVTPQRRNMALNRREQRVTGSTADVLAREQYIAGTLLSDEQRRRQQVYRSLLDVPETPYFSQRMLLAWTDPLDMQFHLPQDARRVGSMLLALPIQIVPPAEGTQVRLPSAFVPYRSVPGPERSGASLAYDNRTARWLQDLENPSLIWLRFTPPAEILPLEIQQATLTVQMKATNRTVKILGLEGGRQATLSTREGPVGTFRQVIDNPAHLQLDEDGGLLFGLDISHARTEAQEAQMLVNANNRWEIEDVQLELVGVKTTPQTD